MAQSEDEFYICLTYHESDVKLVEIAGNTRAKAISAYESAVSDGMLNGFAVSPPRRAKSLSEARRSFGVEDE